MLYVQFCAVSPEALGDTHYSPSDARGVIMSDSIFMIFHLLQSGWHMNQPFLRWHQLSAYTVRMSKTDPGNEDTEITGYNKNGGQT